MGVVPGDKGIFDLVEKIVADLPDDYVVVSWFRTTSLVAYSYHFTGDALDLRPKGYVYQGTAPCTGASAGQMLRPSDMAKLDRLHAALEPSFQGDDREILWRTCTGGNHYNHVHVGGEVGPDDARPPGTLPGAGDGSSSGNPLGAIFEAETWIRLGEAIVGGAAVIGAILVLGKGKVSR